AARPGAPAHPPAIPWGGGGARGFVWGRGARPGAAPVLARAHHGSVSKEQRAQIEDDLKAGRLSCVVATSSLELGIDMGAVDLVIQVESPPSVASGLQRIGRAGHQVGEISQGILYPKHRTDLLHCTVTVGRMLDGAIEEIKVPQNPLDILAQQTIAAAAVDDLEVDHWYEVVRRAAPYRELGRGVFDATLDLIAGRFPSDEFAELRPRVNWDRDAGVITGRRGAQRLAVTSGGSIPDRGLFGVFMVGEKATRVGELDEEMVYESRVGDVFALGATSWRIEDITHDRVLVSPAFGQPGRLPFWIGDAIGRPAELGAAIGAFTQSVADPGKLDDQADRLGLTENARSNLATLIAEQREATGHLPTDRTLVVERFRDELGDWRVILHSPYGLRVHAPWASAISQRLLETLGIEGATTASDDGIILRMPDTDDAPPGADVFLLDPDEVEQLVTDGLADSSMFASRFRECAARALLLPRRDPGRRAPLWQQRQRSAQLLSVASKFPDFPIVLEAVRECLQDVYDLPALLDLLNRIRTRRIRVVETETQSPSPFAASLLFGYVGAFMYADDAPLAERRAAALSLDTSLLAQLLGRVDLRELLDPAVIADVIARLQRLSPERQARDAEDIVDLLRWLGPLTTEEVAARYRGDEPAADLLTELHRVGQIISVNHNARALWAAIDDTARLRDALGVPAPLGIPAAYLEEVPDPVGDLIGRYARTHGPFTVPEASAALGIATGVVRDTLNRLASERRVVEGDFLPDAGTGPRDGQWCHADVLGQIRRGSLAASRAEVAPVGTDVLTRFLLDWQHASSGTQLRGVDGVATVIDQLAGFPLPASAWESLVLPARVSDYASPMLDELLSAGEVIWSGHGRIGNSDGWVALHPADVAVLTLPDADEIDTTPVHDGVTAALEPGGALRFPQIAADISTGTTTPAADIESALWDLVWAGRVSNDSFAPVRALLQPRRSPSAPRSAPAHRARGRAPRLRAGRLSARYLTEHSVAPPVSPTASGRWFALDHPSTEPTIATQGLCDQLLTRYGVITRGSVVSEEVTGGFARVYKALTVFEDNGHVRRGYYVDGLGGAQFASPATVDELRRHALPDRKAPREATVLAATDPANPYGAALEWPASRDTEAGHRPGRKPGALVVIVDGDVVCFVERGGKTLLTFSDSIPRLESAAGALVALVRRGRIARLTIDHIDSEPVRATDFGKVLVEAGFSTTPRGIRLRFGDHA
ncbi:helicase-related protein, partial [Gordonia sp. NPDC057248]|uniref:Lhr family ATP-dependent helicase n=1 Tax=Gordonia sp. NPDC057248 TaxID=3346066 RepID=UPI00362F2DCF